MKQIIFIITLSILSHNIYSQIVTGTVIDENNLPLTGANIIIKEYLTGATSDINGQFSLNTKTGKSTIIISFLGYDTWEKEIILNSKSLDLGKIILSPKYYISEEIIVKATRADDFSPIAYTSINNEELQKRNITQDLPQLLEITPSLVATSEAGTGIGATSFRIRGTDPTRTNVTVNGIPLNDAESQSVFWANMPDFASSVNNLQITRGVGSSTNGSAAFGASLNLFTNSSSNSPYAEISLMGGSFKTHKQNLSIGTGTLNNGFSFDLRLSNLKSDGYVRNGYSDHKSMMFSTTWRNNKNMVRANIIYGKQKTGITWYGCPAEMLETDRKYNPEGIYYDLEGNEHYYDDQSDNYIQTHYQLIYSRILIKNLNLNIGLHYTGGDGYYEEYKNNRELINYGFAPVISPNGKDTISVTDLIQRKMMSNGFYGGTTSLNYTAKKLNLSGGASFNQYDGDHFGKIIWMRYAGNYEKDTEWYKNNGLKSDINAFVKINYEMVKGFHIYGDIQFRHIEYKMKGIDSDLISLEQEHKYNFLNPKAGLYYIIQVAS